MTTRKRLWAPAAVVGLAVGLAVVPPSTAAKDPAGPPPDLALVPADAAGLVRVDIPAVWASELFAPVRDTVRRAGPRALAVLEDRLVPPPSAVTGVTAFAIAGRRGLDPLVAVAFSRPVDADRFAKDYLGDAHSMSVNGKTVQVAGDVAAYFPTDRQLLIGDEGAVSAYLSGRVAQAGPLRAALDTAGTSAVVSAMNVGAVGFRADDVEDLPAELRTLLLTARTVVTTYDLAAAPNGKLTADYATPAAAADARKAADSLRRTAKGWTAALRKTLEARLFDPARKPGRPGLEYAETVAAVAGLGAVGQLDGVIDAARVEASGTTLSVRLTVPKEVAGPLVEVAALSTAGLYPLIESVKVQAEQGRALNPLKNVALAHHNWASANNDNLPTDILGKDGKPLLSWRVAILPQLEQQALYNRFKLDEPWDSEHNKALIPLMPKFYKSLRATAPEGHTYLKHFTGGGSLFDPKFPGNLNRIPDGSSNTIMLIEAGDPVPWTKPEDIAYEPDKPLPKLAIPGVDRTAVGMTDASARLVDLRKVSEKTLRAVITSAGGEIIGDDW